jgi:hypothetical protein
MPVSEELWKAVEDAVHAGGAVGPQPTVAQLDALNVAVRGLELALSRHPDAEARKVLDEFEAAAALTRSPVLGTLAEAVSLGKAFLGAHRGARA